MIDHRHARILAATALDFPLEASERDVLDAHVADCPACRAELAALRHDAVRLAALPPLAPPAWVRAAIGRPPRRQPIVLLAAAALLLTASAAIALVAGSVLRDLRTAEIAPSVRPLPSLVATATAIATTGSANPSNSAPPTIVPLGSFPVVSAGSLPTKLGSALMAAGPDGGLYVLVNARRDDTGAPSRAVLTLLDRAGQPMPGWPVQLTGWDCWVPNGRVGGFSTAADGSTRLVCTQDVTGEAAARRVAFAFDVSGRPLPGWPVELPSGDVFDPPQVAGDTLLLVYHEFAASEGGGSPQPGAWWVTSVAADGTIRQGVRYEVPDIASYGDARLGSDGVAYVIAFRGALATLTTDIVAFDVDGIRPGWPVTVAGYASYPAVGSDGRIHVIGVQGTGSSAHSQTLVFNRDGQSAGVDSDGLPLDAVLDYTGAGARVAAPTVATDGTAFIVGDFNGGPSPGPAAYAIGPTGLPLPGWLYRLPAALQTQGSCSPLDAGCGAWRTTLAVGPDDTLYLPIASPDEKGGGSIIAVGIGGTVRPGWPVRLAAAGAGYWSVVVGADGTVFALAVTSSAGRETWTLDMIDPDGSVRSRTPIVQP